MAVIVTSAIIRNMLVLLLSWNSFLDSGGGQVARRIAWYTAIKERTSDFLSIGDSLTILFCQTDEHKILSRTSA